MEQQEALVTQLIQAFQHIRRGHTNMPKMPIRKSEMFTLMQIKKACEVNPEGIIFRDLASVLNLAPPTITPLINSLVKQAYVERIRSEADRRVVYIRLTEKGMSFLDKSERHFNAGVHALVKHLGLEDTKELIRIVNKASTFMNEVWMKEKDKACD
ncbi:MAG TPA: hypothetical protein DIC19_00190 [Erysipelotrichaceae bacterium]|nr:hypothetical protein [Erysipelotrichaceae bacterium]